VSSRAACILVATTLVLLGGWSLTAELRYGVEWTTSQLFFYAGRRCLLIPGGFLALELYLMRCAFPEAPAWKVALFAAALAGTGHMMWPLVPVE